jgi:hypothetical protein
LPPGGVKLILSVSAGGHVAPGPHAPRTARRALPGEARTELGSVGRPRDAWSVRCACGAARHVSELVR